ncbi:MAG: 30S ribosomal protein S19e [Candidatus Diapherotrites archaeon]|nr:30S ribosomal protein S19e [Candidatus Diapherotrites archaeon]
MATAYDVPAATLINRVAADFKGRSEFKAPEWSLYVKTGPHVQRAPDNPDWWYVRTATVLRRIYMDGPVGTQRLRTYFGGRKNRGIRPHTQQRSGGKIIRVALQQLEKAGYIKSFEKKGRVITPAGKKYLDKLAIELKKELEKTRPELAKY